MPRRLSGARPRSAAKLAHGSPVEVNYVLRTTGDVPVKSDVAFPMPDYTNLGRQGLILREKGEPIDAPYGSLFIPPSRSQNPEARKS